MAFRTAIENLLHQDEITGPYTHVYGPVSVVYAMCALAGTHT